MSDITEKPRFSNRKILTAGLLLTLVLIPVVGAISFTSITGSTAVKINEPLTVTAVGLTPANIGTCTTTAFSFVCTISLFAADSASLSVSILNSANTPILVSMASNSSSTEVEIVNPAPTSLPPGVSTAVLFAFNVLQSATPDTTTLHFTVTR